MKFEIKLSEEMRDKKDYYYSYDYFIFCSTLNMLFLLWKDHKLNELTSVGAMFSNIYFYFASKEE